MPTPISQFVEANGEPAFIITPPDAVDYDPTSTENYNPGTDPDPGFRVRGAPEGKVMREAMPAGATGAITIDAKKLPADMQPMKSKLLWRKIHWTIITYRERWHRGELDGYTLYLSK